MTATQLPKPEKEPNEPDLPSLLFPSNQPTSPAPLPVPSPPSLRLTQTVEWVEAVALVSRSPPLPIEVFSTAVFISAEILVLCRAWHFERLGLLTIAATI
jgi:hypothetical protein